MSALRIKLAIFCIALLTSTRLSAAETIDLLVYMNYPPLIIQNHPSEGVAQAIANILTIRSNGKYVFRINVLPRKRLDSLLASGAPCILPFIAPQFFDDAKMTKYLWTRPLMIDRQVIVYNSANPINYTAPDSLKGKTFGGILGYHYGPLDALVRSGLVSREDVSTDDANLFKLSSGRLDAVSIPWISFSYLRHTDVRFDALEVAATPLYSIERRFMIQGRPDIRDFIDEQLKDVDSAPDWKQVFAIRN